MKNLLLGLILSCVSILTYAQGDGAFSYLQNKNIDVDQQRKLLGLSESEINNIEGSAYSNEQFLLGHVYQNDKKVSGNFMLRYNAFSDEVEIKNGATYGAMLKNPETFAKIGREVYIFVSKDDDVENEHYFIIMASGAHFDLYKKFEVTFRAPTKAKTSYDQDRPAKFITKTNYYLVSKEGIFSDLPTSKSKLLKVMGAKKKDINAYIKSNNLRLDVDKDLAELVTYYNTLL